MAENYRHWKLETDHDNIVWLSFDKKGASANVLSADAMAELDRIFDELRAKNPRGLIIRSSKDSGFIAGADVEEFTRIKDADEAMRLVKRGWDLYNKLEALPFPTLALVSGFCMGGGVELALACRYRVAVDQPGTRFALPEVMLGILPGWGGVKRLPRIVGPTAALDMLLTGRAVDARRARRLGLVDEAVPPRIQDNTARMMVLEAPRPRTLPLFQRLMNSGPMRPLVVRLARKQLASRASPDHYPAPYAILELWRRYDGDPFAPRPEDPASVIGLLEGDTARNLIRIFFLQERLKSLGKDSDFKAQHVHVVGAGVMGGDIAAWCAMRGLTVTLQDQSAERLVRIHFFNPVPQLQLVEVVKGAATDSGVAKRAAAFVRQIDKLPLPVKDSPGFLVNRVLGPYIDQALRMVDEGVARETLDAAVTAFGMPMGPIELAETVGLDTCLAAGKGLAGRQAGSPRQTPRNR